MLKKRISNFPRFRHEYPFIKLKNNFLLSVSVLTIKPWDEIICSNWRNFFLKELKSETNNKIPIIRGNITLNGNDIIFLNTTLKSNMDITIKTVGK